MIIPAGNHDGYSNAWPTLTNQMMQVTALTIDEKRHFVVATNEDHKGFKNIAMLGDHVPVTISTASNSVVQIMQGSSMAAALAAGFWILMLEYAGQHAISDHKLWSMVHTKKCAEIINDLHKNYYILNIGKLLTIYS